MKLTARLFNADCLKAMTKLADESVDLICVDLPYGVSVEAWDKIVPMAKMFAEFRRILSPTGNIVMTAQGRFSAALITTAPDLYAYSMVWAKTRKTQHLQKDYRVLAEHEDVLIFAKGGMGCNAKVHPTYNPQGLVELDKPVTSRNGNQRDGFYRVTGAASQRGRHQTHTNYPTSILFFPSVGGKEKVKGKGNAPQTQKPVALMDYLIRTFSNPSDVVMDCTMGSGTTGVAALQAGRNFIGMEIKPRFYENAEARIRGAAQDAEFVTHVEDAPVQASTKALIEDVIERKRAAYREFLAREKAAKEAAKAAMQPKPANDTGIRYATLCSGIEAVSLAWDGPGFDPVFFSEVGKFQSAFLKQRYPTVPNVGDMTLIDGRDYAGSLDVLWASTPCQSHSRAGARAGLRDPRGNLTLTAVKIADDINPPVFVLENVVGFLNVENGDAFGDFLAQLVGENQPLVPAGRRWTNAGAVCGPRRNVAWRVLDAQYAGLAQRRERVFVVACPVGGPDPAAILFEQGNPANDLEQLQALQTAEAEVYAAGRSVMWFNGDPTPKFNEQIAYTLKAHGGFGNLSGVLIDGEAYRLSPDDREALMGMPRGYTDVPNASDAKRNSAIGNSLAVPDVRWLGERIKAALSEPQIVTGEFVECLRLAA